jgi:hypothetical protein
MRKRNSIRLATDDPSSLAIVLAGNYRVTTPVHSLEENGQNTGVFLEGPLSGARRDVQVATNRLYVCHAASWLHFFSAERCTPAQ